MSKKVLILGFRGGFRKKSLKKQAVRRVGIAIALYLAVRAWATEKLSWLGGGGKWCGIELAPFFDFAWGQVAENRRVLGGKTRRFFALSISSSYRQLDIGGKPTGVLGDPIGKRSKSAESNINAIYWLRASKSSSV